MLQRSLSLVLALLVSLSLSACSDYRARELEYALRYLPAEDALLVLEVQRGLHAGDDGRDAAEALQAVVAGRRIYPPGGGLIVLDFDDLAGAPEPAPNQELADLVAVGKCVVVEGALVFEDAGGELCLARLTRIERFQHVLGIVNAFFDRQQRHGPDAPADFVQDFPVFDEATRAALRAAGERGHAWLGTEGEALVIDLPMTSANAARCLGWIEERARAPGREKEPNFFDQVTRVEVANERARLCFGETARPVSRFVFPGGQPGADGALRAALKGLGVELRAARDFEALRARIQAGAGAPAK